MVGLAQRSVCQATAMRVAVVSQQRAPKIQAIAGNQSGRRQARTKASDGLGAFGQAAEVVEGFLAAQVGREAAFGGHDREGEEGRAGADEAEDQEGGGQRVGGGVGEREGERDTRVDDEVEQDVEEAAEVGQAALAGDGAVEAVEQRG